MAINDVILAAVSASILTIDGRSNRTRPSSKFSFKESNWRRADSDPAYWSGWFRNMFRCQKDTFDEIARRVEVKWEQVHEPLRCNSYFSIRDRVAVTIHYLTHADGFVMSAAHFGMRFEAILFNSNQYVYCLSEH